MKNIRQIYSFNTFFVKISLGFCCPLHCLGLLEPDDPTCRPGPGVAGGLAQLVAAHAQVIRVGVHHQRTANDRVRAVQGN